MSSRSRAHQKATELRERLGLASPLLLARLRVLLQSDYGIKVEPAGKKFLKGSRGMVVPAEGCLYYDDRLGADSRELLEVVAHEVGHLVLHGSSLLPAGDDLMRGCAFLTTGSAALTRYSPKAREEAEASAFAAELICPAREVFAVWLEGTDATLQQLAERFFSTDLLVRQQLAEGLLLSSLPAEFVSHRLRGIATKEQEEAATFLGTPVIVDAGPGTGKTRTLVRRVQFLVKEECITPERILVLTFSNEAAGELRERLSDELGEPLAESICVSTFHGFGVKILHEMGHHIGLSEGWSILDETAQEELLSSILATVDCDALLNLKQIDATVLEALRHINYLKDRLISPSTLRAEIDRWKVSVDTSVLARAKALLKLYEKYEEVKQNRNSVDFSDLMLKPVKILSGNQELRALLWAQHPWVLVDEYQDVSRATSILLMNICSALTPPWAVGDQRQAIYRFRGACPENVANFSQDFPGAQLFKLSVNYRSAREVIGLANQLADLLETSDGPTPQEARWVHGGSISALGDPPVRVFEACSDAAERVGIVNEVNRWLQLGIEPQDIAVLARRNIDVRNIAIALKVQGVRAITTGLLTAEGAGGDLAAVLTCPDGNSTLPRIVYSLLRHQMGSIALNEAIAHLLSMDRAEEVISFDGLSDDAKSVVRSVWPGLVELHKGKFSRDGWATLCDFLFFNTVYLRNLIDSDKDTESLVQMDEVLSVLAVSASHRAAHPHDQPRAARLGLADLLRSTVTKPVPGLVPPRSQTGAVRVMTCHAAKGLEFPCVIVAGQTLPNLVPQRDCLPPILRADASDEILQADSLLFVGVTRAKRAAIVSYSVTAGGGPKSPRRKLPTLLNRWIDSESVPVDHWDHRAEIVVSGQFTRIWGGEVVRDATAYQLSTEVCPLRTYLEDQLRLKIPTRENSLYPFFVGQLRLIFGKVIELAAQAGSLYPGDNDLQRIFEEQWPEDLHANHPHYAIYRPRVWLWLKRLRANFPRTLAGTTVGTDLTPFVGQTGVERAIRLPTLSHLSGRGGRRTFIQLRLQANASKEVVLWSDKKLRDHQRIAFVLMQKQYGNIRPLVLDVDVGLFREFEWKRGDKNNQSILQEGARAQAALHALCDGQFEAEIDDFQCDRCRVRLNCPLFLGASSPANRDMKI